MAIAMARGGALGVLHYNCSLEEQVAAARAVKRASAFAGFVPAPLTLAPSATVAEWRSLVSRRGSNGASGGPPAVAVTEDGRTGSRLLGLVAGADVAFIDDLRTPLSEVMTADLWTANASEVTAESAHALLRKKVAFYDHDRHFAPDIEAAKSVIGDERLRETHQLLRDDQALPPERIAATLTHSLTRLLEA